MTTLKPERGPWLIRRLLMNRWAFRTLRVDCRHGLPLGDGAARGIHQPYSLYKEACC